MALNKHSIGNVAGSRVYNPINNLRIEFLAYQT